MSPGLAGERRRGSNLQSSSPLNVQQGGRHKSVAMATMAGPPAAGSTDGNSTGLTNSAALQSGTSTSSTNRLESFTQLERHEYYNEGSSAADPRSRSGSPSSIYNTSATQQQQHKQQRRALPSSAPGGTLGTPATSPYGTDISNASRGTSSLGAGPKLPIAPISIAVRGQPSNTPWGALSGGGQSPRGNIAPNQQLLSSSNQHDGRGAAKLAMISMPGPVTPNMVGPGPHGVVVPPHGMGPYMEQYPGHPGAYEERGPPSAGDMTPPRSILPRMDGRGHVTGISDVMTAPSSPSVMQGDPPGAWRHMGEGASCPVRTYQGTRGPAHPYHPYNRVPDAPMYESSAEARVTSSAVSEEDGDNMSVYSERVKLSVDEHFARTLVAAGSASRSRNFRLHHPGGSGGHDLPGGALASSPPNHKNPIMSDELSGGDIPGTRLGVDVAAAREGIAGNERSPRPLARVSSPMSGRVAVKDDPVNGFAQRPEKHKGDDHGAQAREENGSEQYVQDSESEDGSAQSSPWKQGRQGHHNDDDDVGAGGGGGTYHDAKEDGDDGCGDGTGEEESGIGGEDQGHGRDMVTNNPIAENPKGRDCKGADGSARSSPSAITPAAKVTAPVGSSSAKDSAVARSTASPSTSRSTASLGNHLPAEEPVLIAAPGLPDGYQGVDDS